MSKKSFKNSQQYNNKKSKQFARERANGVGISRSNQSVIGGSVEFRQKQIQRVAQQLTPEQKLAWEILSHVSTLTATLKNGDCQLAVAFIPNENYRGEEFNDWMDEVKNSMDVKAFSYKTEEEAVFVAHNEEAILFVLNGRTWWPKEAVSRREGFNLCMVLPFPFAPREDGVTYELRERLPKILIDSMRDTLDLIEDIVEYNEGVSLEIVLDGADSLAHENYPSWAMGKERTLELLAARRRPDTTEQTAPKNFKGKQPKKKEEQVQEKNTVLSAEMASAISEKAALTAQALAD